MPQISFPHGLQKPQLINDYIGIIVTDKLDQNSVFSFRVFGDNKFWSISEILEQREAKGDWSNWEVHPTFYKCKMNQVDDPKQDNIINLN